MPDNEQDTTNEATPIVAAAQAVDEKEPPFQYDITVEDIGPATKKVTVQIPAEHISQKLVEQFKTLRQQAAIPGFRPGHAPQKLVEKRFAGDVREEVRRALVSESYEQAMEKHSIQVIGEPQFDGGDKIELPESGSMKYTFTVEVQPKITLPELKGIKVRKPKVEVKDENVDQAMSNLREQQGTLVPVENRGAEVRDYLVADVLVKVDSVEITQQSDAQIVVRPGRVMGIQIDDLDARLTGMKAGETRTLAVKAPAGHPRPELRDKNVEIEITLKDIKKLELAELNQEFLEGLGFANEQELRDALRDQMLERIQDDVQQIMREQVNKYLLDSVTIELPAKLSDRQAERVVGRRVMELTMRGIPRDQIEANIEALRGGAMDEAVRELKLFFILQQVALDKKVDVDEAELNGRVAMLAAQRARRPEKMKQDMAKDGTLSNLYIQMREQKAVDAILQDATIEEYDAAPDKPAEDAK